MTKLGNFTTPYSPTWCPGCGNYAIWGAFKNAATQQGWDNTNAVIIAGIGCHGHIVNFIKLTSFEGLHGRPIPVATGIKLANHRLNVFVFTGDGDCLGEGGNHFIHACRRNHDLTILIHDNAIYALTTGQTSPTSPDGLKTKSTPTGNLDHPLSPVTLAIAAGATFVARAFATDIPKLTELIIAASQHKGLAVIDILQPCITLNQDYTLGFLHENAYPLDENHDVSNKETALVKSLEWGPKQIPLGIFYRSEKPSYESQLPQLTKKPLIENPFIQKNLKGLFNKYI